MGELDYNFDITKDYRAPDESPPKGEYDEGPKAFLLGFERQNYITTSVTSEDAPGFKPEEGYNGIDDEDNAHYDPMAFIHSDSPIESRYIRSQLDNERRKLDVIDSHWTGLVGEVLGGVIRPEVIATGLSGLGWKGIFALDVGAEIGSEAYLQHKQKLRTAEETLLGIGSVAVGTLLMGGAAKWYESGRTIPYAWSKDKPEVDDMGAGDGMSDLSGSAGAARATGSSAESDRLIGGAAAETLGIGPAVRLTSSPVDEARQLSGELVDSAAYTKGMETGETKGVTVEAEVNQRIGEVVSVMDTFKALQKQYVKEAGLHTLNLFGKWKLAKDFDEAVGTALSNGGKHANKQVFDAAQDIRARILEPRKQELIDSGMDLKKTKFATDYFPRVYDRSKIVKNYSGLKDKLVRMYTDDLMESRAKLAADSPPKGERAKGVKGVQAAAAKVATDQYRVSREVAAEAETLARQTIQNMLGGIPAGHGISSLNKRTLALTDTTLTPFLEKRASVVMAKYTSGIDPYLIMQNRYGDEMLTDKFKNIELNFDKMIHEAADGKATARLKKRKENDMKDLYAMRDRILNRVQRSVDPSSVIEKTIQFTKVFNIATQLMGITLTSIPDLARPIVNTGLRSFSVGLRYGMKNYGKSLAGVPDTQARRMGVASQRTLNTRAMDLAEVGEASTPIAASMQNAWSKLSMFGHWTDLVESISAQATMDFTLRLGKKVASGKALSRSETMKVARMGFTEGDLEQFYGLASKGKGGNDPVLKYADTLEWGDIELARKFEAGVGSDVRRQIIRVGHGDKLLHMDQGWVSLLMQYKSFAMTSTNRMLLAGLQQRDFALAAGMLSSIFLGGIVEGTKGQLRGDKKSWDKSPEEWLRAGVDRTGMLGLYNIPFNMIRSTAFDDSPSRYAHRGISGFLGGSSAGQLERVGKIAVGLLEGDMETVGDQAKYMIPYANAMHMRDVMIQLGDN